MITEWIIKKLDGDDYYYVVGKNNEFNITGKMELQSLNSENYHCTGRINCILYVLGSRLETLGFERLGWFIMEKIYKNEHKKILLKGANGENKNN